MLTPGGFEGETIAEAGNADSAMRAAATAIEADYASPLAAHAALEPQGALASVRQENREWIAEVWTATQSPTTSLAEIASAIGLKAEQVILHNNFLGGGFGRKIVLESSSEAARLSKASGLPVRVNWDRGEEFQHGFMRPPTRHKLRAGLDVNGNVVAWTHEQSSGLVLFASFPKPLQWLIGVDFGAIRGAIPDYTFPNHRTTAWYRDIGARTGPWRGLGLLPNGFAVESFVDELAQAAGADPLEFRLRHLGDDSIGARLKRVLQTVADLAGWSAPLPARDGWLVGRGLACGEDVRTVVALVAEVAVNPQTGEVKVERVYCALDCGL
ncbi:MAG: molybdopterin cofactor-binding domain-containing protein, partial [Chloroflexota bacterium]